MSSRTAGTTPLERREIEVRVAAAFHGAATELFGLEVADQILSSAVESLAKASAAEHLQGHARSLADLWAVWQALGGDGRLDLHLDALDEHRLQFHVDRCAYAEMYRALDLEALGVAFSCRRDAPFAQALLPGVEVEQSQTILEGASRCQFTYTLEGR